MKRKYILAMFGLLASSAFATNVSAGLSFSRQDGLYKGREDGYILPYFDIKYNNFFARGYELGYKFYNEDYLSLAVYADLQDGYSIKGSNMDYGYRTIKKREKQLAGGLRLDAPLDIFGNKINFTTALEVGKRGEHGEVKFSKLFQVTDNFIIVPNINSKYFSKKYSRYYFGVERDELGGAIQKEYRPDNSYSVGLGIYAEYYFNRAFSVFGYANLDKYSKEVTDSPIIRNGAVSNVGVGAKFTF